MNSRGTRKPNQPLASLDPRRPAFLVLEQDGHWATYEGTVSGKKALLVFTHPDRAAAFFKAQGTGRAQAVEILVKGVTSVIQLCQQQGVMEFVVDVGPDAPETPGEPIAQLTRFKQAPR